MSTYIYTIIFLGLFFFYYYYTFHYYYIIYIVSTKHQLQHHGSIIQRIVHKMTPLHFLFVRFA